MSKAAPATHAAAKPGCLTSAPETRPLNDCQARPKQNSSTNEEMSNAASVEKR